VNINVSLLQINQARAGEA
jgi:hypothetical protein